MRNNRTVIRYLRDMNSLSYHHNAIFSTHTYTHKNILSQTTHKHTFKSLNEIFVFMCICVGHDGSLIWYIEHSVAGNSLLGIRQMTQKLV